MPDAELLSEGGVDWAYGDTPEPAETTETPLHIRAGARTAPGQLRRVAEAALRGSVLDVGARVMRERLEAIGEACRRCSGDPEDCFDPRRNAALARAMRRALKDGIPEEAVERALALARQGTDDDALGTLIPDALPQRKALLHIPPALCEAIAADKAWSFEQDGGSVRARDFRTGIARTIWSFGTPTLAFHESPAPVGPTLFLNLPAFLDAENRFDADLMFDAVRYWAAALALSAPKGAAAAGTICLTGWAPPSRPAVWPMTANPDGRQPRPWPAWPRSPCATLQPRRAPAHRAWGRNCRSTSCPRPSAAWQRGSKRPRPSCPRRRWPVLP